LAVPLGVYHAFFQLQFIKTVVEHYQLKIIVYDPIQEAIVEWKN
jgi:GH35 family endo-1,4-beta-xylanase